MSEELKAADLLARVLKYIEHYEDAPNWGGPTMYPRPLDIADIKALHKLALPRMVEINEGEVDAVARDLYAASCALDPVDENRVPDWGRGGFKTEIIYWHGLARAALTAMEDRRVR